MLVNFLVMFGVIEVVYRPLPSASSTVVARHLTAAGGPLTAMGISFTVTRDTNIIAGSLQARAPFPPVTPDQWLLHHHHHHRVRRPAHGFHRPDRVPQYNLAAESALLIPAPGLAIVTMFSSPTSA